MGHLMAASLGALDLQASACVRRGQERALRDMEI